MDWELWQATVHRVAKRHDWAHTHHGGTTSQHPSAAGSRALLNLQIQEIWRWAITGLGSGDRQSPGLTPQDVYWTTNGYRKSGHRIHKEESKGKDHFCTFCLFLLGNENLFQQSPIGIPLLPLPPSVQATFLSPPIHSRFSSTSAPCPVCLFSI